MSARHNLSEVGPTMAPESTHGGSTGHKASDARSRRRKLLLGLTVLIALTGALQAVMRLKQQPALPAIIGVLTL